MEAGEMDRKEVQVEVPWIPTTPFKSILPKPVPICAPGEGNHANGEVACCELSNGAEINGRVPNQSAPEATVANVAGDNAKTCVQTASDKDSSWTDVCFADFLATVNAASANSNATHPTLKSQSLGEPGTNPSNTFFSQHHLSPEQCSVVHDNYQDPQGTSYTACCSQTTSQVAPPTPDNTIRVESRKVAAIQINMEEKDPGGEEKNAPANLDNNGTPQNKELCNPLIELDAVSTPFKENHDNGSNNDIDMNKTPQLKPRRRKHRPKVITEGKLKRTRKPVTPKPVQSKDNPTGKRKYVRRKVLIKTSTTPTEVTVELTNPVMPESAKNSCRRSLNFDIGARDESSACGENATVHLGKEICEVVEETHVSLAYDPNNPMKQGLNAYMSLPEDTQAPTVCLSESKPPQAKPKENPKRKRKYVRRKGSNKTSTPTEVTGELSKSIMPESAKKSYRRSVNFDLGARDESFACRENATGDLGKEIGMLAEEMHGGLACVLNTPMKQALNNYTSFPEETKAQSTCLSESNPPGAKPRKNPEGKRKYVRRKGSNKTSTLPTEVTAELTESMMPESAKKSCRRSINFDIGAMDEASACSEYATELLGKEIGAVVVETHVGLAYDLYTCMQQGLNNYMSLPVETSVPSASIFKGNPLEAKTKENPTGKRKYVRRKGVNRTSTPPTELTGELTNPAMPESAKKSCRRSLKYDTGARDESSACRENSTVHLGNKISVVVKEMHVGLADDLNTSMKHELNNYMSFCEGTQSPSTSLSKGHSPGEKPNSNSAENNSKRKCQATAQDGHENSAKITLKSVAQSNPNDSNSSYKRKHSGTIKCTDTSSMNMIGAHYNGLHAYHTECWFQFPNIQKKRRSGKGKTSNKSNTSTVTTTKDVQLAACPQEDAQARLCASIPSRWICGSEYNTARVTTINEATESVIHEYILSSNQTRLTQRSRVRQPNHTAKQVGISDRQTFGDAERPLACVDALVAEMGASLTKKKRTKKTSALFSSGYSNRDEMQQHHKFALEHYHLPSDVACKVIWKNMHAVDTLAEQLRQLRINTEARDHAFHEQNALVLYKQKNQKQNSLVLGDGTIIPFKGSFDPIRKQHLRPKVDLDEETTRVWNLLMIDINSHGINGMDEDKAKWWEEERNVFRGRADSFIARMHLVQGDRRFSQWKGSVVDSVIGVFLTQNVSDHLSSSAFMSLAARFPQKSNSKCNSYYGEGTSLVVNKPQVHVVEPEENTKWDKKILNQSVYDQSSMTIDIFEHSEGKEPVNSNDSCRTTSSVISLRDESNFRVLESAQGNIRKHHSPMNSGPISAMTEVGQEKSCNGSVGKELNDIVSSQSSVISSQLSGDFSINQNPEKIGSCSDSNSEEGLSSTAKYNLFYNSTSFSKLLEMASSTMLHEVNSQGSQSTENLRDAYGQGSLEASIIPSHGYTSKLTPKNSGVLEVHCFDPLKTEASKNKDEDDINRPTFQTTESASQVAISHSQSIVSKVHPQEQSNHMQQNFFNISGQTQDLMQKAREIDFGDHKDAPRNETNEKKEKKDTFNWDKLRIKAQAKAGKRGKTENTRDSLDWEAVRRADVSEIADVIKERGMNNRLAERIKNFLNRLVEEHGSIDLEWLRDVSPDQAKEYLLSIRGLGLKSVECVRLLTLHHLAFPVDTNVGRIAVRLGWVPLQPLPESLQLHLLELYPVLESIQKYLWPRLCKLDQRTLYELHYQMITFGKVFCTKSKPNCNACPMRGECRHFASAFASARLALPGPEQRSIVSTAGNNMTDHNPSVIISQLPLPLPENTNQAEEIQQTEVSRQPEVKSEINICQPIIEEPTTPEPECSQVSQNDIEDAFYEDSCDIPTIKLDIEEFTLNLQNYMQENMELQEGEISKALVALSPEAASIPMPKLKNVSRLRTEHCVYELPDSHRLLEGWEKRERDDPGKYLLAIWTPGETANSIQPPESKCSSQEYGQLCNQQECFSCNSFREADSQIVRGTLLIPCRTAMRGSFPLNGTYFQVNEVFADHDSSLNPISVPRSWIWNLNRRTVYFGTSIPTIFKGLSTQEIQQCFWRGYVCVRGFDRETRAPRPLMARLHFPASKLAKTKDKTRKEGATSTNSHGLKPNPEHPELSFNSHNLQERVGT